MLRMSAKNVQSADSDELSLGGKCGGVAEPAEGIEVVWNWDARTSPSSVSSRQFLETSSDQCVPQDSIEENYPETKEVGSIQ